MFDDDDRAAPKGGEVPRKLDRLSIDALEARIAELEREIARTRDEIARKRRLHRAAADIFKSPP